MEVNLKVNGLHALSEVQAATEVESDAVID